MHFLCISISFHSFIRTEFCIFTLCAFVTNGLLLLLITNCANYTKNAYFEFFEVGEYTFTTDSKNSKKHYFSPRIEHLCLPYGLLVFVYGQ